MLRSLGKNYRLAHKPQSQHEQDSYLFWNRQEKDSPTALLFESDVVSVLCKFTLFASRSAVAHVAAAAGSGPEVAVTAVRRPVDEGMGIAEVVEP